MNRDITSSAYLFLIMLGLLYPVIGCVDSGPKDTTDTAELSGCQLRYPIVLSHHWGVRELCPEDEASEKCEDIAGDDYCVSRGQAGDCEEWGVPEEELSLPPRNTNTFDTTLQRDLGDVFRYFSREIVNRLEDCGNEVFIADKPIYSTYEVRAQSLKRTVQHALSKTNSERVVIIGISQGVQDARFMAAELPSSDADPEGPKMSEHVAAIVSMAGETFGAESADVLFNTLFGDVVTEEEWAETASGEIPLLGDTDLSKFFWNKSGHSVMDAVDDTVMDKDDMYRSMLASVAVLSTRYMLGKDDYPRDDASSDASFVNTFSPSRWAGLLNYLGMDEHSWEELIPDGSETTPIYSVRLGAREWPIEWGLEYNLAHNAIMEAFGPNDGYVSISSQSVESLPDGEDLMTLSPDDGAYGYHHIYLSGRNDAFYAPSGGPENPAVQSSADVYETVLIELVDRGYGRPE